MHNSSHVALMYVFNDVQLHSMDENTVNYFVTHSTPHFAVFTYQ